MSADDEKVGLEQLKWLMSLPEDKRDKYCIETILALAKVAEDIANTKGKIKQGKAAQAFLKDIEAKRGDILPVIIYTVKPQFRDTYLDLMDRFSGIAKEKTQNK